MIPFGGILIIVLANALFTVLVLMAIGQQQRTINNLRHELCNILDLYYSLESSKAKCNCKGVSNGTQK